MSTEYKVLRDFQWGSLQLEFGQIVLAEKQGSNMHVNIKHYPEKSVEVTEEAFYNFLKSGNLEKY